MAVFAFTSNFTYALVGSPAARLARQGAAALVQPRVALVLAATAAWMVTV